MRMFEITAYGKFSDQGVDRNYINQLAAASTHVAQVRSNVELRKNDKFYLLVRDRAEVLGLIIIGDTVTVAGSQYAPLELIYVFPEYRKTSATYWLLYSVKEELHIPIIVDGAVFKDGQALILALARHRHIRGSTLNKVTGEKHPITQVDSDDDVAYVFEQTGKGYSIDYFNTGKPVWLPIFEDEDSI